MMATVTEPASTVVSPSVAISGVDLAYHGAPVLEQAALVVPPGTVAAVLGRSGSGKTTLLRSVAGFIRPVAGTIHLSGVLVSGPGTYVPPEKRNVGLVPQEGALFPHLDVAGNVGFGLPRRTKQQRKEADERIAELLAWVSLPDAGKLQPHELSGGMQQRVALARALAKRPQTVLLDEPFSALDRELRVDLRWHVRELLLGLGAGVILVTHDEEEAESMADAVYEVTRDKPGRIQLRNPRD